MIVVGLTGGIGSGKSTIAKVFRALGVPVFESDAEAKHILNREDVVQHVSDTFGEWLINSGRVDRAKLAGLVFGDKQELAKLNAIIHPAVRKQFLAWVDANSNSPYVINEAAILFESGLAEMTRFTINVSAPVEERIKRVIARDALTREEVISRINNQMSDEQRSALSTWTIVNDGLEAVLPQVLQISNEIMSFKEE
jgi:dephospho-CoA kinase